MAKLFVRIITMRHIDNVFFYIFAYHKPRSTPQSQPLALANGMEPVPFVRADAASGLDFYHRSFPFAQKTAYEIIIIYLS